MDGARRPGAQVIGQKEQAIHRNFRGELLGPALKLSFKEGNSLPTFGPVADFGPLGPRHRGVYRFRDTDGEGGLRGSCPPN